MPDPAFKPAELPAFERGLWNRAWFIILLCLVFAAVDWEMMPLKVFPFIFVFPLMLAAWNRSLPFALVCAAGLSVTRLSHQFVFGEKPDSFDELAAAVIRFFVLLLLAALTHQLGRQTRRLRQRIQMLEGILPICAWCKSIRDEQNNWVQLEGYISKHSAAQFSHGFCPKCYQKHYGPAAAPGAAAK